MNYKTKIIDGVSETELRKRKIDYYQRAANTFSRMKMVRENLASGDDWILNRPLHTSNRQEEKQKISLHSRDIESIRVSSANYLNG